ncbi:MAG TPA: metallophosphoesterase [Bryobacteraceae bacterium]|nr:metallophosphoesterase [Bryobacteraceae bacterium]
MEKAVTIVHLSDSHLGNDYVARSLFRKRLFWRTEDGALLRSLENALREIHPDFVIHTGDIVNKASKSNFTRAAARLRSLFGNAGIDVKKSVLIIPGNHDVKILAKEHEYWGRLASFHYFLRLFFDETDYRSREPNFVTVDAERKIWFFCLNSTLKDQYQFAEGEIGVGQWEWFRNKFETLMKLHPDHHQYVKIVALHHHPHPIEAGGRDRFMQLLDAGTAISLFEAYGVNIVLHGHKHFPHVLLHHHGNTGERHYTVIGAGTATCPFVDEQSGEGNSFNVLKLKPGANHLSIQRWKANNDKKYVPVFPEPIVHPIFPASPSGYRIAQSRAINQILDDTGTCLTTSQRLGVAVDRKDYELRSIAFSMGGSSQFAEVADFDYDRENIESVKYDPANHKAKKDGYFLLRQPLKQGSEPIDLWFTYELKGGFCMRRSQYPNFYPGRDGYLESVSLAVIHPSDELMLVVEFPRKYKVQPRPLAVDQNGVEVSTKGASFSFQPDTVANRFSLVVRGPLLQHRYSISWQVPD